MLKEYEVTCEEGNTNTVLGCKGHSVSYRYDCDGDIISVCNSDEMCPHKQIVEDCDGDYITLCREC